jgi:hypothetical protein
LEPAAKSTQKEIRYEETQYLPADGGDDSDGCACHPGGGPETSTLEDDVFGK